MAHLSLKIVLACLLGFSAPAAAGTANHPVKYSVENGVKVYRSQISPAQQTSADNHIRALARAEQRQQHRKDIIRLKEMRIHNQAAAYERGFKDGFRQAKAQKRMHIHHHNTRRIRQRQRYIAYRGNTYRGYGRLSSSLKRRRYGH